MVHAGNRAVLIKWSKEAEAHLTRSKEFVNEDIKSRLQTINTMINGKKTMVSNLEEKVLELCEILEISAEIKGADEIKSRTLGTQPTVSTVLAVKPCDKVRKLQDSYKSGKVSEQLHVKVGNNNRPKLLSRMLRTLPAKVQHNEPHFAT